MRVASVVLLLSLSTTSASGGDFEPDPWSVKRHGEAYCYPQSGWTVLHIEGAPYERGKQHGTLLAAEIAAHIRCFAAIQCPKSPAEGWKHTRTLVNSLFLRRFDREFLDEMKGIADGAAAGGAKFDGRAIDLVDIAALNAMEELLTLDSALEALPTGLEGVRFPKDFDKKSSMPKAPAKPSRCSAFAANGAATRDGKIVFGHITMSDLYSANYCNVWLDIQPAKGRRFVMQSFPGGIQSGLDYYINDAGLLISETTIGQTRFDVNGMPLASRIRKAAQYAETIDRAVEILKDQNNGLYTNEWLLADLNTNEIAMFELGTHKSRLWRSSKNEWFGGAEGFYWGCNNAKDLEVRLETIASVEGKPASAVFRPSARDMMWLRLYDKHKGTIDAEFGKLAFATPPVAAYHSVDAKVTTTALARELRSWGQFGPPLGRAWKPTHDDRDNYPEIRPLVSNPWAMIHPVRPVPRTGDIAAVDLPAALKAYNPTNDGPADDDATAPSTAPAAWHGTILPASDADLWLALAFPRYERIVAHEEALRKARSGGKLSASDRETIELALFAHQADFELGARAAGDLPLSKIRSEMRRDDWYRIASGKGILLLHALREKLGADKFAAMMDAFGRGHAGKPASTAVFRAAAEKAAGEPGLGDFFDEWLEKKGLPANSRLGTGPFAATTFHAEPERTLIVYGTLDEMPSNREAAEALQHAIRAHNSNVTVPIRADHELTPDESKNHHLLLIGRPDSNRIVSRVAKYLPIAFGRRSFRVKDDTYAHPGSAVIAAAANPENPRFSIVVVAGLEAFSTWHAAPQLPKMHAAEAVVLPNGAAPIPLVLQSIAAPR